MNPLSLIPPQYLLLAKLAIIAVLCAGSAYGGYKFCDDSWELKEAAQLKSTLIAVGVLQQNSEDVGKQLAESERARTAEAEQHRQEIEAWKSKGVAYVQCPSVGGPAPLVQEVPEAAVGFGGDFVDEWNRGMCLSSVDSAACNRRIADGPAIGADTVAPADLLQNQSDNAESCGKDRVELRAWQALAVKNGWVKGDEK